MRHVPFSVSPLTFLGLILFLGAATKRKDDPLQARGVVWGTIGRLRAKKKTCLELKWPTICEESSRSCEKRWRKLP